MELHLCPLLLLIYFAFNSSVSGIDFFKQSLLYRFFLFVLSVNRQILEQEEKIMLWKNNIIGWILLQFPVLSEIDGNSHAFPIW